MLIRSAILSGASGSFFRHLSPIRPYCTSGGSFSLRVFGLIARRRASLLSGLCRIISKMTETTLRAARAFLLLWQTRGWFVHFAACLPSELMAGVRNHVVAQAAGVNAAEAISLHNGALATDGSRQVFFSAIASIAPSNAAHTASDSSAAST